ncbi:ATP-binding protein [uncultured Aquabacterium sp.]|jgi:signal transduction histidine kinase|uniref:sensor histidine kinase n=1 Tax=uncultured Aquabacterium sp. TaxID=158753 RepID=UPI00260DF418|nr:ATP-binding protein [uncultured Aquabacterium sp.]
MKDAHFWLKRNGSPKAIINEIPEDWLTEIKKAIPGSSGNTKFHISGKQARIAKIQSASHTIFALAFDEDRIKSKRMLATEAATLMAIAEEFEQKAMLAAKKEEAHTKRLIHNLKSLTAKTMQEIFYVARQDNMLSYGKRAKDYVKDEIVRNPDDAASAFISILKHQAAQNAEFSAFNKLSGDVGQIKKESHSIHKVLMNVFYLFFGDFTDKGVTVDVQATQAKAVFDYESIHVCIYHIAENSAKYIRQGGAFSVSTSTSPDSIEIIFEMESLAINQDESEKIFYEGYSGFRSVRDGLQGSGIGLYIARQLASINGGRLSVIAGIPKLRDPDYARNRFILSIPRA